MHLRGIKPEAKKKGAVAQKLRAELVLVGEEAVKAAKRRGSKDAN